MYSSKLTPTHCQHRNNATFDKHVTWQWGGMSECRGNGKGKSPGGNCSGEGK